jgi:hypothetical protein
MSKRKIHPPKPVLAYRLGVAGTRDLCKADPAVPQRIGEFLDFLKGCVYRIWKENVEFFDEKREPRLMLICSLAKGVDLLVAELASARGFEIHAPLAFDRETYEAMNFEEGDKDERHIFQGLMARQDVRRIELDGDPSGSPDTAYEAAATVLINHSDALLAVWNLSSGKGKGGTADSFERAKSAGLIVLRMDVERRDSPVWNDEGVDRPYEDLFRALRRQVLSGISIVDSSEEADSGSLSRVRREQERLLGYYQEREWRLDFGWPHRVTNTVLSAGRSRDKSGSKRSVSCRLQPYRQRSERAWSVTKEIAFPDPAREHFRHFDQWADGLSVFYANCMRSTVAITLVLGAVLLGYALAEKLWPILGQHHEMAPVEGGTVVFLTLLVLVARLRRVHARWLRYRMLSEFLRSAALAFLIGGLSIHQLRFRDEDAVAKSWVSFYFRACVRSMGLPNLKMDHKYLANLKDLLIDRLTGQIGFHSDREDQYDHIDWNIRRFGLIVFAVSAAGALVQIGAALFPDVSRSLIGLRIPRNFSNIALILPIFGGALAALVSQESFGRLAHLSASIARRLASVVGQIERAPLRSAPIREATLRAIDEMMAEHEEWFMLYSLRDIEFPH